MTTRAFTGSGNPYFTIASDNAKVSAIPFQCGIDLSVHAPAGFWSAVDTDGDNIRLVSNDASTEYAMRLVDWNKASETGWILFDGQGLATGSDTTLRVYVVSSGTRMDADQAYSEPNDVWLDSDLESSSAPDNSVYGMTRSSSGTLTPAASIIGNGLTCSSSYIEYDHTVLAFAATDVAEPSGTAGATIANTGLALHPTIDSSSPGWIVGKFDDTPANAEIQVYDIDFATELDSTVVGYRIQGVAVDANGYVWAADPDAEQVWVYDPGDSWSTKYSSPISMPSGFAANAIAYRPTTDQIYVGEVGNATWQILDATDGSSDGTLSLSDVSTGWDQAAVRDDQLWVTRDPNEIAVFRFDGRRVIVVDTDLGWIEGIAFYGDELFINDDAHYHDDVANGNRVYKLTASEISRVESSIQFVCPDHDFTYRVAISASSVSGTDAIMVSGDPVGGVGWGLYITSTTNLRPFIRDSGGNRVFDDRAMTAGERLVHVVVDRDNDAMQVFVEGSKVGADIDISTVTGYVYSSSKSIALGESPDGDTSRFYSGTVDQAMVKGGAMSADEIATEYNWMAANGSFWSAGTWNEGGAVIPVFAHHYRTLSRA